MKKTAVLLIFFIAGGFLSAQSYRETRIYVPPVDGEGYIDDLAWFYKQITGEIALQHRTLGRSRRSSDYVITGRLMPASGENIELPSGSENDEYILYVELFDNALNEAIGTQYITYSYPDENTNNALSVIMYNLLSVLPDTIELYSAEDNWRNKLLYFNVNFLWTPRVYSATYQSVNMGGVGVEAMLSVHFLSFLGLKIGAEVTQDWVRVTENGEQYHDMVIDFPAALTFVLRPGDNLMLEPYAGANLNFSLQGTTKPYALSWMAGAQLGIKAGPGIVTFDPRFSMDFGKSSITRNVGKPYEYWRYTIHLGIGYKIGFIPRKN